MSPLTLLFWFYIVAIAIRCTVRIVHPSFWIECAKELDEQGVLHRGYLGFLWLALLIAVALDRGVGP